MCLDFLHSYEQYYFKKCDTDCASESRVQNFHINFAQQLKQSVKLGDVRRRIRSGRLARLFWPLSRAQNLDVCWQYFCVEAVKLILHGVFFLFMTPSFGAADERTRESRYCHQLGGVNLPAICHDGLPSR